MNLIATLIILVGLAPGAVLPAELAGRFIIPVVNVQVPEENAPRDEGSPDTGPIKASLHAGTPYTAIRPAGFSLTKADLRAIQSIHELLETNLFDQGSVIRVNGVRGHQAIMQPDHCHAHQLHVTSPSRSAHAPPASQ